MVKKLFYVLCALVSTYALALHAQSSTAARQSVKWYTNYDEATREAKSSSKPMLLFFTGSDWCGWCSKIEEEAIDTPEFAELAGGKFIFVKLDFPLYSNQDPQVKAQNKALQQKFDVRGFPTLILVDAAQNKAIGTTGYRPGGGKAFADHLLQMVNDYSGYKQKMGALDKTKFSGTELKQLYEKSKELRLANDSTRIVKKGMSSDEAHFFMVERYRFLADEGQIHGKECAALKEKIMATDPLNEHHLQYQIAVIDFETNCDEMDGVNTSTEQAVAPLVTYMEKFGAKDKDRLWRLQLLVSQVYLDKNEMPNALKYAQASYETAPACVQSELSRAIATIRSQIHSSR